MSKERKIELLAPAGNGKALRAAVQSGADAVYIGGTKFGARHSAQNFTKEDIIKQCDYCHQYGVDVHATVNTLVKENEIPELISYVKDLNDAGVDALIVQDIGAAELIHKVIPDMPLHGSTQMTVTSLEGVQYLEDMGFSRVVLARELNKNEIAYICEKSNAEIEVFAHGAICMCYSGQCLMSSILGGRSGNRGRCAQPCRLPYSVCGNKSNTENMYVLSPRDMALVKHLDELQKIGVASLKIEGRLKRAEYVSAVTGIYRKYLDNPGQVLKPDMRELHDAFSRSGFTDGYFTGNLGQEMMSHKNPGSEGSSFSESAKKRAADDANIRKIPITITGELYVGKPLTVTASDNGGNKAYITGDRAQKAVNKPMTNERFAAQLSKTGATPFEVSECNTYTDGESAISVGEINKARRMLLEQLSVTIAKYKKGRFIEPVLHTQRIKRNKSTIKFSAEVRNLQQGRAAAENGIDLIYAPYEAAVGLKREFPDIEVVTRTNDIFSKEKIFGNSATASSNAAVGYLRKMGVKVYGTHRLNIFNSYTMEHYKDLALITLSPELKLSEIYAAAEHTDVPFELIGYGRLPLMLMRNCPLKAMGRCQHHADTYSLKDRRGETFPVLCNKDCIAELINSKPLFMADRLDDLANTGAERIKLIFTTETPTKCASIINIYNNAKEKNITSMRENTFTRGHYYRGVE